MLVTGILNWGWGEWREVPVFDQNYDKRYVVRVLKKGSHWSIGSSSKNLAPLIIRYPI